MKIFSKRAALVNTTKFTEKRRGIPGRLIFQIRKRPGNEANERPLTSFNSKYSRVSLNTKIHLDFLNCEKSRQTLKFRHSIPTPVWLRGEKLIKIFLWKLGVEKFLSSFMAEKT